MTKKLIIKRVGVIRQVSARAELVPQGHPPVQQKYPRRYLVDGCVGESHITFNIVNDWSVAAGVHDPFSLYQAILKRLNSVDTEVTQTGLSLNVATYSISLTGAGLIIFNNGGTYEWDSGSVTNQERLVNTTTNVKFKTSTPDSITIRLENDTDGVAAVSLKDNTGQELILNNDFMDVDTHYYDIDSWHVASEDPAIVPPDVLGYLQGFNELDLYTVFE